MREEEPREIETALGLAVMRPDGVVYYSFRPGARSEEADARNAVDAVSKLATAHGTLPATVIIDLSNLVQQSREARAYLASPEVAKMVHTAAVIVSNPVSRVLGNVFLHVNRPMVSMKLFTAQPPAEAWVAAQGRQAS